VRVVVPTRLLLLLLLGYFSAGSAATSQDAGEEHPLGEPRSIKPDPEIALPDTPSTHNLSPSSALVPEPDAATASPRGPAVYAEVNVAPTRTSIYIGSVSLTMPTFQRDGLAFRSSYVCKVFPYFFYNERGTLFIDVPDADLARLAAGETITFSGQAKNTDGEPRRIEGRAVPASSTDGKIKVRVFVTAKIELIFNTTYFFPKAPAASGP